MIKKQMDHLGREFHVYVGGRLVGSFWCRYKAEKYEAEIYRRNDANSTRHKTSAE